MARDPRGALEAGRSPRRVTLDWTCAQRRRRAARVDRIWPIEPVTYLWVGHIEPRHLPAFFALCKLFVVCQLSGGPPGDRTRDTVIKSHVLYH
jgi:hypothetical protein